MKDFRLISDKINTLVPHGVNKPPQWESQSPGSGNPPAALVHHLKCLKPLQTINYELRTRVRAGGSITNYEFRLAVLVDPSFPPDVY